MAMSEPDSRASSSRLARRGTPVSGGQDGVRILAVAFLIASAWISGAHACSFRDGIPSLRERLESAESVFVAHVTATREVRFAEVLPRSLRKDLDSEEADEPLIEVKYRLLETLKGNPPASGRVYDLPFGPGNCSLGVFAGWDYVFVLAPSDQELGGAHFVGVFSGSVGLGPYREPGEPDPEELDEIREILHSLSTEPTEP
jgi:hypothetical protein